MVKGWYKKYKETVTCPRDEGTGPKEVCKRTQGGCHTVGAVCHTSQYGVKRTKQDVARSKECVEWP